MAVVAACSVCVVAFVSACDGGAIAGNGAGPVSGSPTAPAADGDGQSPPTPPTDAGTSATDISRADHYAAVTGLLNLTIRVHPAVDTVDLAAWMDANDSCPYVSMEKVLLAGGPASHTGGRTAFAPTRIEDGPGSVVHTCMIGDGAGRYTDLSVSLKSIADVAAFVAEMPVDADRRGQKQPLGGGEVISLDPPGLENVRGCAYWSNGSIVLSLCTSAFDGADTVRWLTSALPVILHGIAQADPADIVVPS